MWIKSRYTLVTFLFLGLFLNSCESELLHIPVNMGTIRFAETGYTVELNNPEPTTIILPLSLPLEEDAVVDIMVDEQSTVLPEEYEINPGIPASGIKIDIKKGETEVRFTLNSLNNFEGEKTLILKLASAKGGLAVANTNATTTVILKGNPILYPELRPSVNDLAFGSVETGTLPPSQSYVLSGTKVTADVTVFSSANYEISLDDDVFSNTLTVPLETIEVSSVTIYVRFLPHTGLNQSLPGTITHSSEGIPDAVVRVTGVEIGNVIPGILVSSENFEYGAVAGNITDLSGGRWTRFGGSNGTEIKYQSTGLSYVGYAGSGIGGAITSVNETGSREDISMSFSPISSGVVYVTQMLNLASAPPAHDFFLSLGDGAEKTTPTYINRIYAKAVGGGYQLGLHRNSTAAVYGDAILSYGSTYLVVNKFEFLTGTSTLYILDGAIPTKEPTTGITSTAAFDPASITRYVIRQNTGKPLTATIDGIRVATSWKDAVGL